MVSLIIHLQLHTPNHRKENWKKPRKQRTDEQKNQRRKHKKRKPLEREESPGNKYTRKNQHFIIVFVPSISITGATSRVKSKGRNLKQKDRGSKGKTQVGDTETNINILIVFIASSNVCRSSKFVFVPFSSVFHCKVTVQLGFN